MNNILEEAKAKLPLVIYKYWKETEHFTFAETLPEDTAVFIILPSAPETFVENNGHNGCLNVKHLAGLYEKTYGTWIYFIDSEKVSQTEYEEMILNKNMSTIK